MKGNAWVVLDVDQAVWLEQDLHKTVVAAKVETYRTSTRTLKERAGSPLCYTLVDIINAPCHRNEKSLS